MEMVGSAITNGVEEAVAVGRRVMVCEAEAVRTAGLRLGEDFGRAVQLIETRIAPPLAGRLIVTGIGKSGNIAAKIASTFTSTGTPALFLHPAEGLHGDLGAVVAGDVVLALSNSGETRELLDILPHLQQRQAPIIGILGRPRSTLAEACAIVIDASTKGEASACSPAPTTSTTVQLALGDALAVAVAERRGFNASQYARLHPGGATGRRLTVYISQLMHSGSANAVVKRDASMREAIAELAEKRLGAVCVIDDDGRLTGLLTDGDLKRHLLHHADLLARRVSELVQTQPITVRPEQLAVEALALMENRPTQISVLPVVDGEQRVVGLLRLHDIVKAGVTLPPEQERKVE